MIYFVFQCCFPHSAQHLASAAKAARTVESRPPEKSKPTVAAPVALPEAQLHLVLGFSFQNIHWYVLELCSYIMSLIHTSFMSIDVHHVL